MIMTTLIFPYGLYREWAILVPAWSVTTFLLAYFVYLALAIVQTPSFSEMRTVTGQSIGAYIYA